MATNSNVTIRVFASSLNKKIWIQLKHYKREKNNFFYENRRKYLTILNGTKYIIKY